MYKSLKKELESVDPADIGSKMLFTLALEVEKFTKKSIRDSSLASAEMYEKMEKKSLNDGDPELADLLNELRGKLMQIWAQPAGNPTTSKKAIDEFIDKMIAMSKYKPNEKNWFLGKAKFLKRALSTISQTNKLMDTLSEEAIESARSSIRDTGDAVEELRDKMEKKSASSDGKPELEELRSKLLETWRRETTASNASKEAVNEFVDTLITESKNR